MIDPSKAAAVVLFVMTIIVWLIIATKEKGSHVDQHIVIPPERATAATARKPNERIKANADGLP